MSETEKTVPGNTIDVHSAVPEDTLSAESPNASTEDIQDHPAEPSVQYPTGSILNELWKKIEEKLKINGTIGDDERDSIVAILNNQEFRRKLLDKLKILTANTDENAETRAGFQKYIINKFSKSTAAQYSPVEIRNLFRDKNIKENKTKVNFSNACYPNYGNHSRDNILLGVHTGTQNRSYNDEVVLNPCYRESTKDKNPNIKIYTGLENLDYISPFAEGEQKITFNVHIKFKKGTDLPKFLQNKDFSFPLTIKADEHKNITIFTGKETNQGDDTQSIAAIEFNTFENAKMVFSPLNRSGEGNYIWWSELRYGKNAFPNLNGQEQYFGKWWFSENPEFNDIEIKQNPSGSGKDQDFTNLLSSYKVRYTADGWKFPPAQESDDENAELARTVSACIWLSVLYATDLVTGGESGDRFFDSKSQLESIKSYLPARKVDLQPFNLLSVLAKKRLYYSSSALNSLAMALNSGNHVILTGPPGAGKTTLAREIPELLLKPHLLCTASPDWTTNELIGHYMPVTKKDNDAVLEFEPGFFLQAIGSKDEDKGNCKWLIIDELNRADIDSCMGSLFSVLSGHAVVLPYKTNRHNSNVGMKENPESNPVGESTSSQPPDDSGKNAESQLSEVPFPERIGICLESKSDNLDDNICWYKVPEDFRIICTMNDSDAGMLNQLSYALQRRFSVIRVEAPSYKNVKGWIIEKVDDKYSHHTKSLGRVMPGNNEVDQLKDSLISLFAHGSDDLMQLRVVGFGQVKDIISMVVEGLSCPPRYKFEKCETNDSKVIGLVLTLLANGVVMKVFPQLPAFICNRDEEERQETFLPALQCIAKVFVNTNYHELTASDETKLTIVEDKKRPLLKYLEDELWLLFRNQHVPWKPYWAYAKVFAEIDYWKKNKKQVDVKAILKDIENAEPVVNSIDFLTSKWKELKDQLPQKPSASGKQTSQDSTKNGDAQVTDSQG